MDLDALISQQLTIDMKQQKSAVNDLFPQQQKNRSYPNDKVIPQSQIKLNLQATKYTQFEKSNEWQLHYYLTFPGPPMPKSKREASYQQLKNFANEFISLRSYPGEEKYYKLKFIDKEKMILVFDADKWIRDSFSSSRQQFQAPLSLVYRGSKALPTLVYVAGSLVDLDNYLKKRYELFLKTKTYKLKHSQFGFLKRTSIDLFDYSYNFRENKFIATLKFSVVLASLAAYMIWKHKKELGPKEVKSLQRKASNMKDVKKLDKYIKRL
jgi:hypothetical protein